MRNTRKYINYHAMRKEQNCIGVCSSVNGFEIAEKYLINEVTHEPQVIPMTHVKPYKIFQFTISKPSVFV